MIKAARAARRLFCWKWPSKLKILFWKSAISAKSSPPFFYEMIKAARASRKKQLFKMANQTQFSHLKIGNFRKSSPTPLLLWDDKGRARIAEKIFKMANQTQCSPLKIGTFRQVVSLIFPSDDKGRARATRKMFQYNLLHINNFSYRFLKRRKCYLGKILYPFQSRFFPKDDNLG